MQFLGKAFIKVNGELLESMPGAKLDVGGDERNTVTGGNKVLGFSAKPVPAVLECEVAFGEQTRLLDMNAWSGVTITFECDTRQVFLLRNAWLTKPPVVTAEDGGKVPLVFNGPPAEQVA